MPKRIVKKPVVVKRDGKAVKPVIGSVFDFTAAELAEINRLQPRALDHIILADEPVKPVVKKSMPEPEPAEAKKD